MAIFKLEDLDGEIEVVVFPSTYNTVVSMLIEGSVVVVVGRATFREDAVNIVANDVKKIDEAYKAIKSINVNLVGVNEQGLQTLRQKLSQFPGKTPVYLRLETDAYKSVQILVGEDLFVSPSEAMMNEIKDFLGAENFSVTL